MLIRDIFREEKDISNAYFQSETVFPLLAVVEGFLLQDLPGEQLAKVKQLLGKNLKKEVSFWGLSHL